MDAFKTDEMVMIADLSVCGGVAGKWDTFETDVIAIIAELGVCGGIAGTWTPLK